MPTTVKPIVKKFGGFAVGVACTLMLIYGVSWIKEVWPKPTPAALAVARSIDAHPEIWMENGSGRALFATVNGVRVWVSGLNYPADTKLFSNGTGLVGFEPSTNLGTASQKTVYYAVQRWKKRQQKLAEAGKIPADRALLNALEGN